MKNLLKVLMISTLLLVGCSVQKIHPNNLDETLDTVLGSDMKLTNTAGTGYKYYLPRGMKTVERLDFNEKLYSNGYYYYLYVDVIDYYNKVKDNYRINANDYYFAKTLEYGNKKGYITISEEGKHYQIRLVYNHAKIECAVAKEDIGDAVLNASSILSSIRFHYKVVDSIVKQNILDTSEKTFTLYESKKKKGNFLDYVNEYDQSTDQEDETNAGKDNDTVNQTEEGKHESIVEEDMRVY